MGAFVVLALRFAFWAAHHKLAALDCDHGVRDFSLRDFGVVGLHLGFSSLFGSLDDKGVNLLHELHVVWVLCDYSGLLFGFERDVLRPDSTLFDPGANHLDLVLRQWAAALLGRHQFVIICRY